MIAPSAFDESKHTMICPLGTGGFGTVNLYLINGTTTFRAIKFARNFNLQGKELHDFVREVHTMYSNQHPTIIQVFGYGIPESDRHFSPWIELEFIPCGTAFDLLRNSLRDDSQINPTRLHIILFGTAYSLSFLHSRDVIHRDVKSTNVLLDDNLEPRLADFGFARELKPGDDVSAFPHTMNYAPPELLLIKRYTNKVDVFSFGMMVFELSCLTIPYSGMPKTVIAQEIIAGRTPAMSRNNPYANLYDSCCQQDPDKRPTMWDIACALNAMSRQIPGLEIGMFDEYRERITSYDKVPFQLHECGTLSHLINAADTYPRAMYQLGWLYYKGIAVEKNIIMAAEFFRSAAYFDDPLAIQSYIDMINSNEVPDSDELETELEELENRLCELNDY